MSDDKPSGSDAGISTRAMEIAVALILFALGALVMFDSVRLGAGWADDGPQSGYFPFYIGLLICLSSVATLAQVALAEWRRRASSAARSPSAQPVRRMAALRLVLSVLVPTVVYVAGIQVIGIYVASAVYIAVFMRWLGKYTWVKSAAVGVGVSVALFLHVRSLVQGAPVQGRLDPLAWLGY